MNRKEINNLMLFSLVIKYTLSESTFKYGSMFIRASFVTILDEHACHNDSPKALAHTLTSAVHDESTGFLYE